MLYYGGSPVHYRMPSSNPALYPPEASNNAPSPELWQAKRSPDIAHWQMIYSARRSEIDLHSMAEFMGPKAILLVH